MVKELGGGMFWVALNFFIFIFYFIFYVSTPVEAQPGALLLPFEIFIVLYQPIKGLRNPVSPEPFVFSCEGPAGEEKRWDLGTRMVPSKFLIFATSFRETAQMNRNEGEDDSKKRGHYYCSGPSCSKRDLLKFALI